MKTIYLSLFIVISSLAVGQTLKINEILASNNSYTYTNGDTYDEIEVYNLGNTTVTNLSGYYLTDDITVPQKFVLGGATSSIVGGGFRLIYASGTPSLGVTRHTNFTLSKSGGTIYLSNSTGVIDQLTYPAQNTDISYARIPDGTGSFSFTPNVTEGSTNNAATAYQGFITKPVFSQPGGFYANSFALTITSSVAGASIYYTLDGSDPDPSNLAGTTYQYKNQYPGPGQSGSNNPLLNDTYRTLTYTAPLNIVDRTSQPNKYCIIATTPDNDPSSSPSGNIKKCTVLKVKIMKSGYLSSEVVTNSYFIGSASNFYNVPVVSLGINPKDFWGYQNGINVPGVDFDNWRTNNPTPGSIDNGGNLDRNVETKTSFNLIPKNSPQQVVSTDAGIELGGRYSPRYSAKAYNIKFKSAYGSKTLGYPVFSSQSATDFPTIVLRPGSSDSRQLILRDMFCNTSTSHLDVVAQDGEPAVLYINGEYWGMTNIRENTNANVLQQKFGIKDTELDITGQWVPNGLKPANPGDIVELGNVHNFVNGNNMNDNTVFANYKKMVNTDNLMDYLCVQTFYGNHDWPSNNHGMFRKRVAYTANAPKFTDGRFNWYLNDLDWTLAFYQDNNSSLQLPINRKTLMGCIGEGDVANYPPINNFSGNWLTTCCFGWNNDDMAYFLFRKTFENITFRSEFINRYADLLNTTFKSARLTPLLQNYANVYTTLLPDHYARYNGFGNINSWNTHLNNAQSWFTGNARINAIRSEIDTKWALNGQENLTLDVSDKNHGYVHINTIDILPSTVGVDQNPYPWQGVYFRNNQIKLIAVAKPGYKFDHWDKYDSNNTMSTSTNSVIAANVNSGFVKAKAFFIPIANYAYTPTPHNLNSCNYIFDRWEDTSPAGSSPANSKFVYLNRQTPLLADDIEGFTSGAYNLVNDTRVTGLGISGVAFKNTSDSSIGYPKAKVGGFLVALNTTGVTQAWVQWKAQVKNAASRKYNIRLQYRVGAVGPFYDISTTTPSIEFVGGLTGTAKTFTAIQLPSGAINQPYVQLLWRYYSNGTGTGTSADELLIDDIYINKGSLPTSTYTINNTITQNGNVLSSNLTGTSYQWINCATNAAISGATSQTYSPTASGDYAVNVTNNGCTVLSYCYNFISTACTVFPAIPSISSSTSVACPATQVTLTASGCSTGTITWSNSQTGNSIVVTGPGTYNAYCTVASCSSSLAVITISANANCPTPQTVTIVPAGAIWSYWDQSSIPSANWYTSAYNFGTWPIAPAELGYGDNDEATVISYGGSASNKYITSYYQKNITINSATGITQADAKVKVDDGAIVYVNGTEVYRDNLPQGAITFTTLAIDGFINDGIWKTFTIPVTAFQNGNNIISVEMHQVSATSSDVSFDFELKLSGVSITTTSITKLSANNGLSVYPNPAKTELFVVGIDKNDIAELIIKDVLGRELIKTTNANSVKVEHLTPGNYFISVVNKNSTQTTFKFIKE